MKKNVNELQLADIVPEYNSSFFLVRNLFRKRIEEAIAFSELTNTTVALDVGCGVGILMEQIHEICPDCKLYGIDINVNVNRLNIPNCDFRVEDVTKLGFAEDFFDIVYALDTLEHIENITDALNEIRRVLKPGGQFIVSGPTENFFYKFCRFLIKGTFSEKEGPGAGAHLHTINGLDERIRAAGFQRKESVYLPKYSPLILFKLFNYVNRK